jgi:peptide/nickel transport system ATP-binding protein
MNDLKNVPLLQAIGLRKHFPVKSGWLGRQRAAVHAVDDVSFEVSEGETLGIVGESGCGKSTTARLLMQLILPDSGSVLLDGKPFGVPEGLSLREGRKQMQMVFQDAFASLNPRLTIEDTIAFGPRIHAVRSSEASTLARDLLGKVGLEPKWFIRRYPHELSGGQRQRVNIARALAMNPRIVLLDEPVAALDKSIEAQVLNLLNDLKADLKLTYVFISHDLNVVRYISDRVMVMYLGKVVEIGSVEEIYQKPLHPYTRALLSARPSFDPDQRTKEAPLSGDPPNPIDPPSGCRFRTRCVFAEGVCEHQEPALTPVVPTADHRVACHMFIVGSGHRKKENPHPIDERDYRGVKQ